MLKSIFRRVIANLIREAYERGLAKGYELGYLMGKVDRNNRGIILSAQVDQQVEDILAEAGW